MATPYLARDYPILSMLAGVDAGAVENAPEVLHPFIKRDEPTVFTERIRETQLHLPLCAVADKAVVHVSKISPIRRFFENREH
jgi:hypothetical protein